MLTVSYCFSRARIQCGHGTLLCTDLLLANLGDPRFLSSRTGKLLCYVLIDVGLKFNFNNSQPRVFSKQTLTIFSLF